MIEFLRLVLHIIASFFKPRTKLAAEILILRQQLNVLRRQVSKRPQLSNTDRCPQVTAQTVEQHPMKVFVQASSRSSPLSQIRDRSERLLLSAAADGFASFGFSQSVETPRPAAGERQVKEYKAEQDREIAAIEDRQETSRHMLEKIGKRHFARENERNGTGEEAQ